MKPYPLIKILLRSITLSYQWFILIASTGISVTIAGNTFSDKHDSIAIIELDEGVDSLVKNDPASALKFIRKGLGSQSNSNKEFMAESWKNFGIVYYKESDYDSAIYCYKNALALFKNLNDTVKYAEILLKTGNVYFDMGDLKLAESQYTEALKLYRYTGNRSGQSRAMNNMANALSYQGNYKKAIEYYFNVLRLEEQNNNKETIAACNYNLGIMYSNLKNYENALTYCRKSLSVYDALGEKQNKCIILNQLAIIHVENNHLDSALYFYDKALNISHEAGFLSLTALIENNIAEALLRLDMPEKAFGHFNDSYQLSLQLNDKRGMALALTGLGKSLNVQKYYSKALVRLKEAYTLSSQVKSVELVKFIAEELSIAYEGLNDSQNALKFYKIFKVMEDSLLNSENIEKITTLKLEYDFEIEKKQSELVQLQKDMAYRQKLEKMRVNRLILLLTGSGLFLIMLLVLLVYRYRQKSNINELKAEINKNMQRLLGQQMNPHFIFNTLKSIQNFILDNNIERSNYFLTKFSKLIRKVLENSQYEMISLHDELEALELYLELENLRLKNKFDYNLKVEGNIDRSEIKVPSLLLQPYVENAIWHGISKMEKRGSILISIANEGDHIRCSLEDNGLGRNNSDSGTHASHKSLGTTITEKRINLINTLYKIDISPRITDLTDKEGQASGTRVEFVLPLIYN